MAANPATTYSVTNFTGPLFHLAAEDVAFLRMVLGLGSAAQLPGGFVPDDRVEFTWQTDTLSAPSAPDGSEEGGVPTDATTTRSAVHNVMQIFHRSTSVSYTKQGATRQLSAPGSATGAVPGVLGDQPVMSELAYQVRMEIVKMTREIEKAFLVGTYNNPNPEASPYRKTRGIITALTTNVSANGGTPRALTGDIFEDLIEDMFDSAAPMMQPVVWCNGFQKRQLSSIYNPQSNEPRSRTIGGVSTEIIVTDFGELPVRVNRWMPTDQVLVADMSVVRARGLQSPKGIFFTEPIETEAAADRRRIYGECGLEYGPEQWHGVIKDLTTS